MEYDNDLDLNDYLDASDLGIEDIDEEYAEYTADIYALYGLNPKDFL